MCIRVWKLSCLLSLKELELKAVCQLFVWSFDPVKSVDRGVAWRDEERGESNENIVHSFPAVKNSSLATADMGNAQGRQSVADDKAQRRGSISWNFRYPLIKRRDQTTLMVYNTKMSVSDWLNLLGLQQYEANFQMENTIEDILDLTDSDLKQKGIRQTSHRTKMLASLIGVQAKFRQSLNIEGEYQTEEFLPTSLYRR
ncbi:uncharacterized protein LOC110118634 [Ceratitis capitata]|uniref:uncharacterized protein LOC110118634 n=1 Tax=Ceratitis capitata TaxID=7213 RepID=UPI000A0FFE9A|nr:uncharacterized protein LOC110118634 [Ceratitis capitata]